MKIIHITSYLNLRASLQGEWCVEAEVHTQLPRLCTLEHGVGLENGGMF